MNNIKTLMLLSAILVMSIVSCKDDDYSQPLEYTICVNDIVNESNRISQVTLDVSEWPNEIRMYFNSEFSGFAIESLKSYSVSNNAKYYLLEATNSGLVLFDESFNFICGNDVFQIESGKDDEELALEEIPQIILDYIENNYPDIEIEEAEFEDGEFEIKLKNGIELCFDQAGAFIGEC